MAVLRGSPKFPDKLQCLFWDTFPSGHPQAGKPIRWQVAYGGRDGAKSWSFARALLIRGALTPKRILCCREIQKTISESVHLLLADQIQALELGDFYEVQDAIITGKPRTTAYGTDILFTGLRHVDSDKVKSFESFDIAWIEEARNTSRTSLRTLENTIRKDGSQLWLSFNPLLKEDEVYKRFVLNPPPDAMVVKINWRDNPWASEVLRVGREQLQKDDPDEFAHIWEGECRQNLEGAVYAKELRQARSDGRITRVPYDRAKPVYTAWDLGKRDHTSIWFVQFFNSEYRIIDFYQNRGMDIEHYLKVLQDKSYVYAKHYLPHDAEHKRLGMKKSIYEQIKDAQPEKVPKPLPPIGVAIGINAVRTIFPNCYFDEEKTDVGVQCLGNYRYEVDEHTGGFSKLPLHDENSDAADAFRMLAIALKEPRKKPKTDPAPERIHDHGSHGLGWMGT